MNNYSKKVRQFASKVLGYYKDPQVFAPSEDADYNKNLLDMLHDFEALNALPNGSHEKKTRLKQITFKFRNEMTLSSTEILVNLSQAPEIREGVLLLINVLISYLNKEVKLPSKIPLNPNRASELLDFFTEIYKLYSSEEPEKVCDTLQ